MPQNPNLETDEIDLRELFAVLWFHKFLITLITSLFIFLSGYYLLIAEDKFIAKAIFKIEQNNKSPRFNLSNELGALASIAGISTGGAASGLDLTLERAKGREFIINIKEKLELERDPYLNSYDPDYKDPLWKSAIKQIIGWERSTFEKKAVIEKNIIDNYRDNVIFKQKESGAIEVSVTHIDPDKASDYANFFMEEIRDLVENETQTAQRERLNYLSETLADALQEMDKAQQNLKNYALENSANAQENFIYDSLKLRHNLIQL